MRIAKRLMVSRTDTMAGRPQLRIGTHGNIKRVYLGGGVWLARCRYRDTDGATRIIQRLGPADEYDQHGKLAEDALVAALTERKHAVTYGEIGLETKVINLVEQHLDRLAEDGRSPVTMSTYRFSANKLAPVHRRAPGRRSLAGPHRRGTSVHALRPRFYDGPPVQVDPAGCSPARGDGQRARQQSRARRTAGAVQATT